jgi:hypothetical protein
MEVGGHRFGISLATSSVVANVRIILSIASFCPFRGYGFLPGALASGSVGRGQWRCAGDADADMVFLVGEPLRLLCAQGYLQDKMTLIDIIEDTISSICSIKDQSRSKQQAIIILKQPLRQIVILVFIRRILWMEVGGHRWNLLWQTVCSLVRTSALFYPSPRFSFCHNSRENT